MCRRNEADKFLFFLRYLELTAADTPTSIASDIHDEAINATGGIGGMGDGRLDRGGAMADFGGMPGEGGRGRGRKRGADAGMAGEAGMMDAGMMGGGPGMGGNMGNQMEEAPMKRQDLLAYEPKETIWNLRYDFIEFAKEENAENADDASEDDGESSDEAEEDNEEQAD